MSSIRDHNDAIQIFNNEAFGQVRTIMQDGEVMFVGADVARIVGYVDTDKAIRMHCKSPKLFKPAKSSGLDFGPRGIKIIPERDLYRLVMRSKLPAAEQFEEWVVGEVLPSIRKNGGQILV